MKTKRNIIILLICALLFVSVPFIGGMIDFGSGTDDQAGEMIQQIDPNYEPRPLWVGYEPSEKMETVLFALQILIGIVIFAVAFSMLQKNKQHESGDSIHKKTRE